MLKKRVLLGFSGGIDSSISAYMLKQSGFEVIGITFITFGDLDSDFVKEAKNTASLLNLEHVVVDVRNDFKRDVIDYFIDEYHNGRTPNPCVQCNNTIKWKLLYEYSEKLNCDKISSGHYVDTILKNDTYYLKKGIDSTKDQSYFLWNLPQKVLQKCIFPLAKYTKAEVKKIAKELGLESLNKKQESMGVCFLQNTDYRNFIATHSEIANSEGNVIDTSGNIIGTHKGVYNYTIGQKRDLNIFNGENLYVASIDTKNNTLTCANKSEIKTDSAVLSKYYFNDENELKTTSTPIKARVRGYDCIEPSLCTLKIDNKKLTVNFNDSIWALCPGQSIVFYKNDIVIGGAIVD